MAAFTVTGYKSPGVTFDVDGGGSAVANTDTLKLNGVKQTVQEWVKRGCIRLSSTTGNVNTYHVLWNPEMVGQMAG